MPDLYTFHVYRGGFGDPIEIQAPTKRQALGLALYSMVDKIANDELGEMAELAGWECELAIRPASVPMTPLVALRDLCPDCGDPRFDFAGDAAGSHSPLVKVCISCRTERAI